jgi:uncharacterized membrane protein (GlpM family)
LTYSLALQIFASFFVGGGLITFLSLLAEKANEKIAGIIMMFPTTIVLGYFFLGITTSADKVSSIVPATLIPLGMVVFSSVIYISLARFYAKNIQSKIKQIIATLITSSIIWFALASPFALWKFRNLVAGAIGYFLLMIIAHYILNRPKNTNPFPKNIYSRKQIVLRALFTGTVISIVVLLGKTLNPFWGGIFTMFPAATFASLIIFHSYYEPEQLFFFMRRAPLGSLSLFIYAISVMILFPLLGIVLGTFSAYCISALFSIILIKIQ